jgi:GNAT superfamily N-acetyltransferase
MPQFVNRSSRLQPRTQLTFRPLTEKNWPDLEVLFGPRGASGGCWCMWWRLQRWEYDQKKGDSNRLSLRNIVASGSPTGILTYADAQPVGWCAIAPRPDYSALARSRVLMPVDDRLVWSVTCFYIAREWRRRALTVQLLNAAVAFARKNGAAIVEGYPHDPQSGNMADAFAWTGLVSAFRKAGFEEVARRSPTRPIMRLTVKA